MTVGRRNEPPALVVVGCSTFVFVMFVHVEEHTERGLTDRENLLRAQVEDVDVRQALGRDWLRLNRDGA
jgi:hypothetical protein